MLPRLKIPQRTNTRCEECARGPSRERCALCHSGRDAQQLAFRHGSSRGTDAGHSGSLRYWLYNRMRNVGGAMLYVRSKL